MGGKTGSNLEINWWFMVVCGSSLSQLDRRALWA